MEVDRCESVHRVTEGQIGDRARGLENGSEAGGSNPVPEGVDAEKAKWLEERRDQVVRRVACCTSRPRVRKLINKSAKERSAVAPGRP